jgi:hypothetical protein
LQHGVLSSEEANGKKGKIYSLDFTYPFSPIQAFSFAIGMHYYKA